MVISKCKAGVATDCIYTDIPAYPIIPLRTLYYRTLCADADPSRKCGARSLHCQIHMWTNNYTQEKR